MVAFCDDASVIGAEFYVMRRVEGIVPRASLGAALDRDGARRLSRNAVDTLSRSTGSMAWLAARTPEDAGACVIHGDFRLDNLVLDAEDLLARYLEWRCRRMIPPDTHTCF